MSLGLEKIPLADTKEFSEGWKNYEDVTNPWKHVCPKVTIGTGCVQLEKCLSPYGYIRSWEIIKKSESAKLSFADPRYRIEVLKSLNANMLGFAMSALKHEDVEVAVEALGLSGLLSHPDIGNALREYYNDAGIVLQERFKSIDSRLKKDIVSGSNSER